MTSMWLRACECVLCSWQGVASYSVDGCQPQFCGCVNKQHACATQEHITGPWQLVCASHGVGSNHDRFVDNTRSPINALVIAAARNRCTSRCSLARELWRLPHLSSRYVCIRWQKTIRMCPAFCHSISQLVSLYSGLSKHGSQKC